MVFIKLWGERAYDIPVYCRKCVREKRGLKMPEKEGRCWSMSWSR